MRVIKQKDVSGCDELSVWVVDGDTALRILPREVILTLIYDSTNMKNDVVWLDFTWFISI